MGTPPFTTQTNEPAPWNDCSWASLLMLANKASDNAYPNTRAEREALRLASGDTSPSNSTDNIRGALRRYDYMPQYPAGQSASAKRADVLDKLSRGYGASLGMSYPQLPLRLRRWSPGFTGGHRVYAERYADGRLWWMDPLGRGTYSGEWVTLASIDPAIWWTDTLLVAEGSWQVADIIVTEPDDCILDIPKGVQIRDTSGAPVVMNQVARIGWWSPFGLKTVGGTRLRAIPWSGNVLRAVYTTDAVNIRQDPETSHAAAIAADRAKAYVAYKP